MKSIPIQDRTALLRKMTVVITGASSGIGRATAHAFAERGARVVLAARNYEALQATRRECEQRGGSALVVPTDVTREDEVRELAQRTTREFGHFDAWINNAAVTLFGRIEEVPMSDFARVIETNVLGYAYGARFAIRHFRERGRGVLVNVSSAVGYKGQPYTSAYAASKFAIRGLGESLRMELLDAKHIHVCTSIPGSIDTPLFEHAANHTGRAIKPLEPVYAPEQVAYDIVGLAQKPRRELVTGATAQALPFIDKLAPALVGERAMARTVERDHLDNRAAPPTDGNLFEARRNGDGRVHGGWEHLQRGRLRRGGRVLLGFALVGAAAAVVPLYRRFA